MGAPPDALEALAERLQALRDAATVRVWPEHWHAVMLFRAMATQWRAVVGSKGLVWLGLDYPAIPIAMEGARARVPRRLRKPLAALLPQLQVLEKAAATARNRSD